jgi:hypothetical protein
MAESLIQSAYFEIQHERLIFEAFETQNKKNPEKI